MGERIPVRPQKALAALGGVLSAERARWPLWLPVALGAGVGFYFALPVEPGRAATVAAAAAALGAAFLAGVSRSQALRMAAVLAAAAFWGFGAAKVRTEWVRAPVLERKAGPVTFAARVISAEPHGIGFRLLLAPEPIRRLPATPARVRVTVRYADAAPSPGTFVRATAVLMPPPGPAMPGDYDFARWAYFRHIGAVGYLYGRPHPIPPPGAASLQEQFSAGLQKLRDRMTARIRTAVPGTDGAIAAALITGERAAVSPADEEAYRDSGLTHVLSISGLHLALAGGIFFWTIRALLALFPAVALRYPVKKWAAVAALAGSLFYLLISGADIPAVRSFVMLAAMFFAILIDRPALSMRSVALAATLILLFMPESLLDAGCQMSFASVAGLIALAEWSAKRRARLAAEGRKPLPRFGRYVLGGVAASLVATLASAPIAIFHFDRAAQYGLISNLAADPVVGFVIMPAATLAMVLMPFGLERLPLLVMGKGVGAMTAIAYWTADLPGAGSLVPVWPLWCFLSMMAGFLWIVIWRRRWRWLGLIPAAVGIVFAQFARPPDLLVARDMGAVAVRTEDGRLAFLNKPKDDFAAANWLKREGDIRTPAEAVAGPKGGVSCDAYGCLAHARDGSLVAYDLRIEALSEDCRHARVVVSAVPALNLCKGPFVIDRFDVYRTGGYALWLGKTMRVKTVAGMRGARPWAPPWRPKKISTGG